MIVTLSNIKITAQINTNGAELISLKSVENHKEYIWEGNPKFWGKHAPILFPIVGTLKNNSYTYKNQNYNLSRHGFARDNEFCIINSTESEATFSLKSSDESKLHYPFDFELQITYTLLENELKISYKVINYDTVTLPFSIGAHPAFALPNDFESYTLEFNQQETLKCFTLENDLISDTVFDIALINKKLPLTYSTFENDALIFKTLESKEIIINENTIPYLKVTFDDFENLGIWTKVGAPFICIEPWLGYSDSIHASGTILEKEGIHFVQEKEKFECSFSIEIL